jgi:glycosyltransferase involved in cell wall biosynthesis
LGRPLAPEAPPTSTFFIFTGLKSMAIDFRGNSGVLIPAYNAAHFIAETLTSLMRYVPKAHIAVIDDGSQDGTAARAEALGVAVLRHEANRGKGTALMTGLQWARSRGWEWAVTMDADGQHSPEDLSAFQAASLPENTAIVVGRRRRSGSAMPPHRRFSNALTTRLISGLAGKPIHDAQSGYRAYRLAAVEKAGFPCEGRFEWESQVLVLCCRRGFSVAAAEVATVYTENGSHMRLVRDTLRFLRMYWRLAWTH